ncbi:MAG: TIGR00268 family protein [Deltaproteobacteria bacterium]|nr:MAG: TIGR00268 family protein [Deltaproteobacteria bacterium]
MEAIATDKKYDQLKRIITESKSAVVAFSGGVDSTFLLAVCVAHLENRVLAVTSDSEVLPRHELAQAKELAQQLNCEHLTAASRDLEVAGFADNPPERCYFCKRARFIKIKQIAKARGYDWVFDGSNIDDAKDYRPGRKAVTELGIRSPLVEAGLGKTDIRILSKALNLTTWDQPSAACLASRIPYHTTITREALTQIETAENKLRQLGLRLCRVRHHEAIARIELGKEEMRLLLEKNLGDQIVAYLENLGYQYVTIDLKGYRTGSMNEVLAGFDSDETDA